MRIVETNEALTAFVEELSHAPYLALDTEFLRDQTYYPKLCLIQVAAPGLAAADAVELIGVPLETIVKSVNGVEHVYTQAEDNGVLVTARFLVGSNPEDAAIRIEEKLRANQDRIPVGVPDPKVTVRGIDDVPAIVLTLTPKPGAAGQWTDQALYDLAHKLRTEIAKVDDVGLTFITGGRPDEIRIAPDPAKLNLYGVPLGQVMEAASQANRSFPVGNIREDGQAVAVTSGRTLASAQEVGLLTVRSVTGAPSGETHEPSPTPRPPG